MAEVSVEVAGRAYRLACRDGDEPGLLAAAARLDATATQLTRNLGGVAENRLLLMAALLVTGQLIEEEERSPAGAAVAHLDAARQGPEHSAAPPAPATPHAGEPLALSALADQLERLAARLEAAAGVESTPGTA